MLFDSTDMMTLMIVISLSASLRSPSRRQKASLEVHCMRIGRKTTAEAEASQAEAEAEARS